jgi:hypothetical protein
MTRRVLILWLVYLTVASWALQAFAIWLQHLAARVGQ